MQKFLSATLKISRITNSLGGVILALMMFFTVVDVVMRYIGKPITGTFELVAFAGALIIGMSLPQSSLEGAHVNVDILTEYLPDFWKRIFLIFTKLLGFIFFILLTWSFFLKGNDLYKTHEVSLTLHVPYYPVAYLLSFCGLIESLVLLSNLLKAIFGGGKHE
ncbi:MAG: TRAP transporter small permease [Proteobacteria bacterium]|nr:TRAP transporter small permease [Pseudomonadota bacterium]